MATVVVAILQYPLSGLLLWVTLGAYLLLVIKRGSLRQAVLGFINLHFNAAGVVRGLFRKQISPHQVINAVVLNTRLQQGD